jgi:hypothetical protein
MPSAISNLALLDKCKQFILADPTRNAMDELIKDALITANREISNADGGIPLAWNRETYDELFTRYYAEISAITEADPAVITADSLDPDLDSDHGFQNDDVVLIQGIYGSDYEDYHMNDRLFRVTRTAATTLNLKWLNAQDNISSTSYGAYDSGGYIYHAGILIPKATIEPASGTADYRWTIKRIFDVMFDLCPAQPITEQMVSADPTWFNPGGRPSRWRYLRYNYNTAFDFSNFEHMLFFYPPCSNRHNIRIFFEKEYPDLATWTSAVYPPHPPEVHDAIWHRALANLATNSERARRETASTDKEAGRLMGQIEVLYAKMWMQKVVEDEAMIQRLSRQMLGHQPSSRGFSA